MTSTTKQWTILGNGAIGHLLACRFAQKKIPATVISRTKNQTTTEEVNYQFNDEVRKYLLNTQSVTDCREVDHLVLAVKAH